MLSFPKPGFPSVLCWRDSLTCLSGFPYFANIGLKNALVSSLVNSTHLHFQKWNSWKWLLIDVTLPCFPALLQVFFCSLDTNQFQDIRVWREGNEYDWFNFPSWIWKSVLAIGNKWDVHFYYGNLVSWRTEATK